MEDPAPIENDLKLDEDFYVPPPAPKIIVSDDRILAHISTDKPFYQPGETVFVEVHLIDSITKKPVHSNLTMAQ